MQALEEILSALLPDRAGNPIRWEVLAQSAFAPLASEMAKTPQSERWHGEGDVLTHTKMVCEALVCLDSYDTLTPDMQQILFLAALLHDVGKPACTRSENGQWVSPRHTIVGSSIARSLLWEEFGLCGSSKKIQMRETVCALIRYHALPLHILERDDPGRFAVRAASVGVLAKPFSLATLSLLVEADIRGRIAQDTPQLLDELELFQTLSEEAGCLHGPYPFPDDASRYDYLSGRNILPGQCLYDESWGQIVMLSALPGAGKDTYIQNTFPELPMLSLDVVRRALSIAPADEQLSVIKAASEEAKGYLRRRQPFVFNATNLSESLRNNWTSLFIRYGAMVRIVYLEAEESTRILRNQNRRYSVPENVVAHMKSKLSLPMPWEARNIEWISV